MNDTERISKAVDLASENGVPGLKCASVSLLHWHISSRALQSALAREFGVTRQTIYNILST